MPRKSFIISLLFLPLTLFGQLLSNDIDIATTDEYSEIKLISVKKNITIKDYGNFYISFEKSDLIELIDTLILDYTLQANYINKLKISKKYLLRIDSMYITDYYQYEPSKYNLDDERELTKFLILELACPLLNSGKLNASLEGTEQTKIFKSTGYFGRGSAPTYWSENWRPMWICPPITVD